ncbi:MAG: alkaline phosphatase family protein [Chloroflexi bacterium]|nr:alkaline phosphatase family protein [Chloroflexota bacterium]
MPTHVDLPSFALDGETYVRPDFAGRGLANVAPTVLRLLAPSAAPLDLPALDPDVLPESMTRGIKSVVLLVADGLGHVQLQREIAAGNAPNLGELIAQADAGSATIAYSPLSSVFPTTTVAALGTLNSGVAPSQHGLLSYSLYLPEFDMLADMIRWGPLNRRVTFADPEFGSEPETFFWAETMYARLHAAGVRRTFAVNPNYFGGSALTRMLHRGATYDGYVSTSSLDPIVSRLLAETDETTYIYAYWPTVDTVAHVVGPLTPEHSAEVAALDFQIGRLLKHLPRRDDTLLLLLADHGHIDSTPEQNVNLAEHLELMAMLRVPPAGERRAIFLYARPGADAQVVAYAHERLHEVATPMLRDEAVRLGLFGPGPLSARAAERIGDVLLFPRGNLQLVSPVETADGTTAPRAFRGLHGGLTPDEALVPLLVVRS